jgi:hypothetical protein
MHDLEHAIALLLAQIEPAQEAESGRPVRNAAHAVTAAAVVMMMSRMGLMVNLVLGPRGGWYGRKRKADAQRRGEDAMGDRKRERRHGRTPLYGPKDEAPDHGAIGAWQAVSRDAR